MLNGFLKFCTFSQLVILCGKKSAINCCKMFLVLAWSLSFSLKRILYFYLVLVLFTVISLMSCLCLVDRLHLTWENIKVVFGLNRCTVTGHVGVLHPEGLDGSASSDKVLVVAQRLASEILSNANISLVSVNIPISVTDDHVRDIDDVSGLCLRFGSEISRSSVPCLLTVTVEGRYSGPLTVVLRINCEESIFGLNLLNRIGAIFA